MTSYGFVGVAVASRPLEQCTVLQPIGEVGVGICVVSVWLTVAVGGGVYISVTSSVFVTSAVTGLSSSSCVGSSTSVICLSVVTVMTVRSSASFMGSLTKDLLLLGSSCCCFVLLSAISRSCVSQYSAWLNFPHLRHRLVGFVASSDFFEGWNFKELGVSFLCIIFPFPSVIVTVWSVSFTAVHILVVLNRHFIAFGMFSFS